MTKHRKPHTTKRGKQPPSRRKRVRLTREDYLLADFQSAKTLAAENLANIDKPRKPMPTTFLAERPDHCARCHGPIVVGERCHYRPSDGLIVHHSHEHVEPEYDICPTCFLTRPCECTD